MSQLMENPPEFWWFVQQFTPGFTIKIEVVLPPKTGGFSFCSAKSLWNGQKVKKLPSSSSGSVSRTAGILYYMKRKGFTATVLAVPETTAPEGLMIPCDSGSYRTLGHRFGILAQWANNEPTHPSGFMGRHGHLIYGPCPIMT
jgi:hypothetical protein